MLQIERPFFTLWHTKIACFIILNINSNGLFHILFLHTVYKLHHSVVITVDSFADIDFLAV